MIDAVRAHAAHIEHAWDAQAIDWPLTSDSVVVEVGGYTGRWALQIAERYAPRLYVFEPQRWAADVCRAVLGERAHIIQLALGTRDAVVTMAKWETDGCTLMSASASDPEALMVEIGGEFGRLGITHIDLLLMNIEGYEYTLIPHMLDQGILPDRLIVQFHELDPAATARIAERLAAEGYRVAWDYGIVLTAWERTL